MTAGFSGEVAGFYAKYRRGYDPEVTGWLAEAFVLDSHGIVLDLGCGTGQLTIPLAARSHAVLGMDPASSRRSRTARSPNASGYRRLPAGSGSQADKDTTADADRLTFSTL